ncbi:MAG: hypothetical protein IIA67_09850, partial [Planctomycetes bacterium]|nr:hypothetical protein [Planctomycetota bacterium]
MNLVGKIFVVVLFVQSLAFMSFAVCVYGTHKSWKDAIDSTEVDEYDQPKGYAPRLKDEEAKNRTLRNNLDKSERKREAVQASMTQVIAKLEAENRRLAETNDLLAKGKLSLVAEKITAAAIVAGSQQNLEKIATELDLPRKSISGTRNDRDMQFDRVVVLTDFIHQLLAQQDILAETNEALLTEVTKYRVVFKIMNLSPDPVLASNKIDVNGVVLAVGREDLLEISIGSDDGLK